MTQVSAHSAAQAAASAAKVGIVLRRLRHLLLLGAVIALTIPLWLPAIGTALVVADPPANADAVVPLGGDMGARVRYAADLLAAGHAPLLLITDLIPGSAGELRSKEHAAQAIAHGVPAARLVYAERVVRSTYQELLAVRELAGRQGWRSLIIVTSPEHTRRTRLMADEVFAASGIAVAVRPVQGYGYDPATWWRDERERMLTLNEYPKLLAFLLGYRG
jgi:uncharacterized SAM-binding protein YcdF (DUF218 family)